MSRTLEAWLPGPAAGTVLVDWLFALATVLAWPVCAFLLLTGGTAR